MECFNSHLKHSSSLYGRMNVEGYIIFAKNAKGELKIYRNTEILTINFKKIIFLGMGKKGGFSLLLRVSLFSEVHPSDCGSLNNMQLSCSEYSPGHQMYKCYIGVGHARFRMSANMETRPGWCDGCGAEVIHGQSGIKRGASEGARALF